MKEQLQGMNNTIIKLKEQISHMNKRRSKAAHTLNFKVLDSQNIELTEHVTALQEQNERFRAENEKVKKHYKELYDSIKITRAKTIEKTTSLLTENEKLKAQLKGKMQCVTMPGVKPNVLAPCMYAIDVELTYIKNHRSGGRGDSTHWPLIYLKAQISSYTSGHLEVSELAACLEKLHFPLLLVMSKFSRICFSFDFKSALHHESSL
ncbi:hypothetical protein Tco_0017138 [Tanacetum coccineum]